MPPFLGSDCCQTYARSYALTDEEIAVVAAWGAREAPEGDPATAQEDRAQLGGLSRVDLTLEMPEPYTPNPPDGAIDDQRCFILDWPADEQRFITGLAPRPGQRALVHHLIVSRTDETGAAAARARDAEDDAPGFDCSGGTGDLGLVTTLGGSLVGGDYPRGIGTPVDPTSSIILQVHYALPAGEAVEPDLTSVDFRLDDSAEETQVMVAGNPGWLVGDGMSIPAGEPDVGYYYRFRPLLYTGGKAVSLQGVTPHMHRHASKIRLLALHEDGTESCLLDIPDWQFGWEQPYWFEEPALLGARDEIYVECRFDNSAGNQPDGDEPRDLAWGDSDQDMCAAFLTFTAAP